MHTLPGLGAWNRACELAVKSCAAIRHCDDSPFIDEVTRTSLSVATILADGYEQDSDNISKPFVDAAKGACAGLRTQLYIAAQLDLLTLRTSTQLMQESLELSQALDALNRECLTRTKPIVDRAELVRTDPGQLPQQENQSLAP